MSLLFGHLDDTNNAVGNTTVHISLGTCASFSLSPTVGNKLWILVVLYMPRKILFIVMEVPVGLCTVGLSKWNFQVLVAGLFLSLLQHLIATEAVHLRYLVPSFSSAFTSDGGGNMADFQDPPCLGCSGSYWLWEGGALRGALCIPAGPLHPGSPAESSRSLFARCCSSAWLPSSSPLSFRSQTCFWMTLIQMF